MLLQLYLNGFSLPKENKSNCAYVIPAKIGMILIGLLTVFYGVDIAMKLVDTLQKSSIDNLYTILWIVSAVPVLVSTYYFIMYFIKSNEIGARAGAVVACRYVVLSAFIVLFIQVLSIILGESSFDRVKRFIIQAVLVAILYMYFMNVAIRVV